MINARIIRSSYLLFDLSLSSNFKNHFLMLIYDSGFLFIETVMSMLYDMSGDVNGN